MIVAVFTALSLATNYALIGFQNVKLMDTLVFIVAFLFGVRLVIALVGLQATFGYDLLTNFASWLFLTTSLYQAFIIGNLVGAPFSIAHEGSNVIFFATVAPAVIVATGRMGIGFHARGRHK